MSEIRLISLKSGSSRNIPMVKKIFRIMSIMVGMFFIETILAIISVADELFFLQNFVIIESLYLTANWISMCVVVVMFNFAVKRSKEAGNEIR
eukprot:TRINITY_DN10406_c0_g1_i1.p1 TRINITY_DN10406_c0_g1~~TRINITY_DN10406_c0_g1_i1.p1  ORF type:complete len:103 (-),score=6.81 TRINITY_DN10406_c0_g1_i1:308-586(-)